MLIKSLFKFVQGAAHLWDLHEIGLARQERKLQVLNWFPSCMGRCGQIGVTALDFYSSFDTYPLLNFQVFQQKFHLLIFFVPIQLQDSSPVFYKVNKTE